MTVNMSQTWACSTISVVSSLKIKTLVMLSGLSPSWFGRTSNCSPSLFSKMNTRKQKRKSFHKWLEPWNKLYVYRICRWRYTGKLTITIILKKVRIQINLDKVKTYLGKKLNKQKNKQTTTTTKKKITIVRYKLMQNKLNIKEENSDGYKLWKRI